MPIDPDTIIDEGLSTWLDAAADVLRGADKARREMAGLHFPARAPAILDRAHIQTVFGDRDLSERVLWIVNGWAIVAGAHLSALGALCSAREVVFGPAPLVRAAFEYSSRVIWLLAEKLTPEQRLARALLEQLLSAEEACKIAARLTTKGSESHRLAKAALADQRAEIIKCFSDSEVSGGRRDWKVAGEELASPTTAVEYYGTRWGDPREWMGIYDLLSGHTHPGLAVFEMFDTDEEGMPVSGTDRETLDKLLRMAIVPYYQSMRHLQAYAAWPSGPIDEWELQINRVFVPDR